MNLTCPAGVYLFTENCDLWTSISDKNIIRLRRTKYRLLQKLDFGKYRFVNKLQWLTCFDKTNRTRVSFIDKL